MPAPQLSTPDLVLVFAYILAMTAMGAWFTRKQKDLKTYFVGGRNYGWFLVLVSIVATETSAVTFLSVPGVAYNPHGGNFTFLQLSFGYVIGRCLVAWLLLPLYMRGELFSAYQVLKEKFGPAVQRVASALFLITRTIADGLRLFLTALVMQYVGIGVEWAIVLVGVVTILYTYLGGMKAVLWTDLVQFAIKISGAALAGVFVLRLLPGGWDEFVRVGSANHKFDLLNFSTDPTSDATLWAGVIGGAVFSMASHGADQLMVQRYLCARSLGQARIALVLSGFTILVQFLLFLGVGAGMFVLREAGLFDPGGAKTDEVFGLFIVTKLPVGVVGVLVAAILAAAMSTLSSSLNSSSNAVVNDFYRPLRPGHSETYYVTLSRVLTVVFGMLQMGVALVAYERAGPDTSVVKKVLAVAGFTTGLILGLFLLGRMKRPVSSAAAAAGLVAGFAAVLGVWLPGNWGNPILAWPWFAPVGAGTTVGVALLVSAFTGSHGPTRPTSDGSPQPGLGPAR
ncbi:MAG TPA: sodium/solute symporter [Fimbriiglobus sp.]|jgi:SSS family transporter